MDNSNRALIIGAVVVAAAIGAYFLLVPSNNTPPKSADSEKTQPTQAVPSPPTSTQSGEVATEQKFKAADKDNSGLLEGAEADAYKAKMAQVDTNNDGKISRDEFVAGTKAGHIN